MTAAAVVGYRIRGKTPTELPTDGAIFGCAHRNLEAVLPYLEYLEFCAPLALGSEPRCAPLSLLAALWEGDMEPCLVDIEHYFIYRLSGIKLLPR
jgi:hypothetical protein